jgi:hypothetical protein
MDLFANSAQLRKAAALLAASEPSVCNGVSEERPGWLTQDDDPNIVVLTVGIFSTETYRISRQGYEIHQPS